MTGGGKALWLIPAGCFGLVVVCAGVLAIVYGIVRTSFRSSEPYRVAVARARAHPDVIAALGTPIEEGAFPMGSISTHGASGSADLSIPIKGPNGKGTVYVTAQKFGGRWEIQRMEADAGGRRIDLTEAPPDPAEIDL